MFTVNVLLLYELLSLHHGPRHCSGVNHCVHPDSDIEILSPRGDGISRWAPLRVIRSRGKSPPEGIIERVPTQNFLVPSVTGHRIGYGVSPDSGSTQVSVLNLVASRIMRNKLLLFKKHPVYNIFFRILTRHTHIFMIKKSKALVKRLSSAPFMCRNSQKTPSLENPILIPFSLENSIGSIHITFLKREWAEVKELGR